MKYGLSYPWPEAFDNWNLPVEYTDEQWATLDEMISAAIDEMEEVASYGVPSQSDRIGSEVKRAIETLEQSHKFQTDWRDERIQELEEQVRRLWIRVDEAERG